MQRLNVLFLLSDLKLIRLEIEAENREDVEKLVADMCERFLTNPVIEDSCVEISES